MPTQRRAILLVFQKPADKKKTRMSSHNNDKKLFPNVKTRQKKVFLAFSLQAFFNAYLSALKSKALFFVYPLSSSKTTNTVLKSLEKNSRIAGYKFCPQNQNVKIFLSYDLTQNKPLIPRIIHYSLQGRTCTANFLHLQKFRMQNPNSFTLIGTHRGILELQSCLFYKCGGKFLISLI